MNGNRIRDLSELDWLVQKVAIIRTAWKLVFISFLAISIVGFAAVFATAQPVYYSRMVLSLPTNLQALIYTDAILGAVARNTRLSASDTPFEPQDIASKLLVSELKKGSGLFSITVTDHSPHVAKVLLDQLFLQLAVVSKPKGTALANVQQELDSLTSALTELKGLSTVLRENAPRLKDGTDGDLYARSFVTLVSDIVAKEQRVRELQNSLKGINIDDVAVPPTLMPKPNFPGFNRKLALVAAVSLLLPISFVLLRDLWRRRRNDCRTDASTSRAPLT
jgi:hypothetical protein